MSSNLNKGQLLDFQCCALDQFREKIKGLDLKDSSDHYLIPWLAARNYDVDQAEKMLHQSLEWRKLYKVNDIFKSFQPNEVLSKYFSVGPCGTDKFGCQIWFTATGRVDVKGILFSTTKKDYLNMFIRSLEEMSRTTRQSTLLLDMDGFSWKTVAYKPVYDLLIKDINIYEAHYPGLLRRVFVINVPSVFPAMFNLVKPLLNPNSFDKIKIFDKNKEKWLSALTEEIDADQLPAFLGGTMTDPDGDPYCPDRFNRGGKVPAEMYFDPKSLPKPSLEMDCCTIIGGSAGRKKIKFNVQNPGSILSWEFISENGDVAYRICRKIKDNINKGAALTELLVPLERVESHMFLEKGQIICDVAGSYVFEFDNTFSLLRSKKIFYSIWVQEPSAELPSIPPSDS